MPIVEPVPRDPIAGQEPTLQELTRTWRSWFNRLTGLLPRTREIVFDPVSVAANTTAEQSLTVKGAKLNDMVIITKPSLTPGLALGGARVSAEDTVQVTFINASAGPINPGSETYKILLVAV